MSTGEITRPFQLLRDVKVLRAFAREDNIKVDIDWETGAAYNMPKPVVKELQLIGYAIQSADDQEVKLNSKGLTLMSKLLVDWTQLKGKTIEKRYIIEEILAAGSESVTFLATHVFLASKFCLKVMRPGKSEGLDHRIRQLSSIGRSEVLVTPIDFFSIAMTDTRSTTFMAPCIVFPYIESKTFEKFLEEDPPLTPFFLLEFLVAVSNGLATLEERSLRHGDLHGRNILCRRTSDRSIEIRIIDVGAEEGQASSYGEPVSDLEWLKRHLWTVITKTQIKKMSIQKHLGAPTFELIKYIFSRQELGFKEIVSLIEDNHPYKEFKRKQDEFISKQFSRVNDSTLSLLRHEEIGDPIQARDLFLPYQPLFKPLSKFGSAILYGHRGSGKSSYLAALAYVPQGGKGVGDENGVDYRKLFGIFFACRQGEFKQFNKNFIEFTPQTNATIKHILVLKIIRKTIGILRESVEIEDRDIPSQVDSLIAFLQGYVKGGIDLVLKRVGVKLYHNLHATLLRNEMEEVDALFVRGTQGHTHRLLGERELVEFFETLRGCEPDLAMARFMVLFDDAGAPNMPADVQMVLNELIKSSNPVFCVKVSTERYAYTRDCADGKPLESTHDYSQFDVSSILRIHNRNRRLIEQHFARLINKRLAGYKSNSIVEYLGNEPVTARALVSWLAGDKRNGNGAYAGWQMVWQLADRTPRQMLEMVTTIFDAANIDKLTEPELIDIKIQSEAIISYSTRKLLSLSFIPGAFGKRNNQLSVGSHIMECVTAFGRLAKFYLQRGRMNTSARVRYNEVLAIELDDSKPIDDEAKELLQLLVRYAVFDDTSLAASRDDRVRKPIYILNRIYSPALEISYRREMHWRLSTTRFTSFITSPQGFVQRVIKDKGDYLDTSLIRQREFEFSEPDQLATPENDEQL